VEDLDTEERCRVDMWRCLSQVARALCPGTDTTVQVVEEGLHYLDKPDGLMG
jgi:hypothetical protein